jgi:hypothetical protein
VEGVFVCRCCRWFRRGCLQQRRIRVDRYAQTDHFSHVDSDYEPVAVPLGACLHELPDANANR